MSSNASRRIKPGKIIIISSPSGGGKTTITRELLRRHKRDGWRFSISVTTRPRRRGAGNDREGRDYFFRSAAEFAEMRRRGEFAESCRVHKHSYGTPRGPLDETVRKGGVILLDVDVKGAFKIKRAYPQAASIFILPPSRAALRQRLKARGTETPAQLKVRRERSVAEMQLYERFDYTVINDRLKEAIDLVDYIILSLHTRKKNLNRERISRITG
ncbi:MAG: guanylate kinase [Candidatus Zixiibacteriota bacterium]